MGIKISGIGAYLPEKVFTNHDFEKILDTNHEWIYTRTGIASRHFAKEGEKTFHLGTHAAARALTDANIQATDIDCILVATTTPDDTFPSCGVHIQREIGASKAFAFDIQAVCAGFIYGLSLARSLIISGDAKRVLLVAAERFSSILDFKDRSTAILFGDGAGAFVLEESSQKKDFGYSFLKSQGEGAGLLYANEKIFMNGAEVFKNAIRLMSQSVLEVLKKANLSLSDIDVIVPHQANQRIIEGIAQKLGLPIEKFIVSIQNHGNTSAASIPLAFWEGIKAGQIKRGQKILFVGLGAGLAFGAFIIEY
jgi:3-oxoacyl-[acyl-carrier-protein] synthase-3